MKLLKLGVALLITGSLCSTLFAEKLTVYTEEFPPFNFTENKKITGLSTEIIQAVMKKAGLDYSIKSFPWARSYKLSQAKENSFIYSISRRVKRENLFQWVGIVTGANHSVYALKDRPNIVINKLEDLKKYKIGTIQKGSKETYLSANGFDVNTFQRMAGDNANLLNYKKLKKKRIDVWLSTDSGASFTSKQVGDNPSSVLKKVFEFEEMSKGGYYLAASLTTPKETVEKVRAVLESFKKSDEYKMILKKWGK